jgi:iron-sulfur cluster assembly accessory protein
METEIKEPVRLTEKAAQMVDEALKEEGLEGHGLRVAVAGGGCAGLQYVLDFTNARREGDVVFSSQGVTIYLDNASLFFLKGTEIDYVSGIHGSGFSFNNPNPMRRCACSSAH